MKKFFKCLLVVLCSIFSVFTLSGCDISDTIKTRLTEQKVEFYNYTVNEETIDYEEIDDNSVIHVCFPFTAKNTTASKFEFKASKLLVEIEFEGETKYADASFVISLLKERKDDYILLVLDESKEAMMEAVTIDNIVEEDKDRFYPYYSAGCKDEKYYISGNNGYALKASIDLKKLDDIQGFGALKKSDVSEIKITFTLISTGGFDSGEEYSLTATYKYDDVLDKYVDVVVTDDSIIQPSTEPSDENDDVTEIEDMPDVGPTDKDSEVIEQPSEEETSVETGTESEYTEDNESNIAQQDEQKESN